MSALHVRVRLAGEEYAFGVADVLEVAKLGDLTPVPGAGAAVAGVCNLRGHVLAVVDLGTVLGLPSDARPERIVVVEEGGRKAGLAVDSVLGVEQLPEPCEDVESHHLAGAALVDGALVGVVDAGSVLDAVEGAPTA